jgi:hypothetical protein
MSTTFWDRLWRSAGIQFVVLFVIAYFIYGDQPGVGSPPDTLVSFYDGNRMRILIAAVIYGMAVLNLLWFAAAIRGVLRDAGQDGWGAAVTASSAALGGVFFVLMSVDAALAHKIAGSGNPTLTSGLNDVAWVCIVMSSFPRAMLIMGGTFGLWRAGMISNALFGAGVAVVVLVLLGGTTWATNGIWAPDGAYSRFISPVIGIVWIVGISGVLLKSPSAARTPDRAAVPQW